MTTNLCLLFIVVAYGVGHCVGHRIGWNDGLHYCERKINTKLAEARERGLVLSSVRFKGYSWWHRPGSTA